jgi:photosystem II stability/assembly factor-like uncharacterized protein
MKSKFDARIRVGGRRPSRKPVPGGKALQRLFAYLGQRDPAINDEVIGSIPVERSARPAFGLTARARNAPVARGGGGRRKAASSPAKAFAAKIGKAAASLSRGRRRDASRRAPRALTARAAVARALAPAPVGALPAWRSLGPTRIPNGQTYGTNRVDVIGRVACIAVDPKNPKHLLCGSAGGGIWESLDAGSNWAPRTDNMPSLATGAIAFDPIDPKIVYAGSGEGNFYFNLGAGVYRSGDGGATWKVIATAPFVGAGFYDIVVDPKNRKTLYAATTNGFYVSTNAGSTWSVKRAVKCWDISIHPAGGPAAEILAAFADGLFVSTSGGSSFAAVSLPSAPPSTWARLAVDRVTASPDIAYAFGAAGGGPYLWRRSGTIWSRISALPTPAMNVSQAWYDWYVAATPDQKGIVYLGAIDAYRGELAGSTWKWTDITTQGNNSIHPDQHCLAFAPNSSKTIYLGNDGGVYRSSNAGGTWTALNKTLGITEIEYMASDPTTAKWLMAGTQDNGTIRFDGSPAWDHIADGDGGDCGVNQSNPNEIYHSYYSVTLERSADKGTTWTSLAPPAMSALFYPPVEVFGATVAIGGVSLDVSRNAGNSWATVALGLPAGDVASAMDVPDANTIFVGTSQGRVLRIAWNGSTWKKKLLTSPAPRYISCITVDPGTPTRLWVTLSQLGGGRVYRSDDTGGTWLNRTGALPNIPMNSVAIDTANSKHLWIAADVGVYETQDLGNTWASFSNGLPNAMAADLLFHKKSRLLFCGTRNRGVWVVAIP